VATETRKRVRLGDLLLEKKLISEQQLTEALVEQRRSGRKLGRVLIDIGAVAEADLHGCLATALNIPFVDLAHLTLDHKIVTKLPETHARRHRALAIKEDARGYLVCMADPTDLFASDELARVLQKPIRLALAKEAALLKTIDLIYRRTEEIVSFAEELDEELKETGVDLGALTAEEGSPDAPVIKLIQSMFQDAVHVNASDIHIEPDERCLRIRQRVDGLLQEQIIDGNRVAAALVTRLKLMCGLDIAEKRKPQDGRFSIKIADKSLDVRLSTMPIYHGEAIVLRLLDQ
jgi:MSHA biogenesis protein MshE